MQGVSVIIPCFNAGSFIGEAVASVHETMPHVPYEIIIVDDASTDNATAVKLQEIAAKDPKVRAFSMAKNSGQSVARNYALDVALYDVIIPLDADDKMKSVLGQSYLDLAFSALNNRSELFAVTTDCRQFGALTTLSHLFPFHARNHLVKTLLPAYSAFRREDAIEAGGYNPKLRFAEDWDFYTALMNQRFLKGQPLAALNLREIHMFYRTHTTGQNASVSQRVKKAKVLSELMARSPEIYDYFFSGKSAAQIGGTSSKLYNAFDMAVKSPLDFTSMATAMITRRIHNNWTRLFGVADAPPDRDPAPEAK